MFLNEDQVVLQNVRLDYAHLVKPIYNLAGDLVYSVRIIIDADNSDAVDSAKDGIKKAISKAIENERITEEQRKEVGTPLRVGDFIFKEADLSGTIVKADYHINCFSIDKPTIVNDRLEIMELHDDSLLNGHSAHAAVFFYFSSKGGVSRVICQINHIMLIGDEFPSTRRKAAWNRFKTYLLAIKNKLRG